ncbi:hypothetical protein ACF1G3_37585, partial [Streptomyces rochei]|uniref:hypothetical protein n=1 Tax=Streptomyces rochei TaxID=1928 RepID=UPI003702FF9A
MTSDHPTSTGSRPEACSSNRLNCPRNAPADRPDTTHGTTGTETPAGVTSLSSTASSAGASST